MPDACSLFYTQALRASPTGRRWRRVQAAISGLVLVDASLSRVTARASAYRVCNNDVDTKVPLAIPSLRHFKRTVRFFANNTISAPATLDITFAQRALTMF